MDLWYTLVMFLVKVYRFLHLGLMKLIRPRLTWVMCKKFRRIGLNVVLEENEKESKESRKGMREGYEMSKIEDGSKATMTIHDKNFFVRLGNERGMGISESYIEGLWDCDQLEEFSDKLFQFNVMNYLNYPLDRLAHYLQFGLFNLQSRKRAYEVAKGHYDLGEGLFESFLDPSMTYTCAYWKNAKTLEEAQKHKLDLIARKLKLKPGMRVLELGCGWGGLAYFLAKNYKVSVVACNIAKDGCKTAQERCRGLPVEVRNCDYREVNEKFDRVVAVGLMEHVGPYNYKEFFQVADRCLDDHGLFLVHTIGVDNDTHIRDDPFFCTYIFPNGALPRATEVTQAFNGMFTMEDWHNFGPDYTKTLLCWYDNFIKNWPTIRSNFKNPTQFYRMWTYYLLMAAGAFKSRKMQLWQIVLSKNGLPGGYESER